MRVSGPCSLFGTLAIIRNSNVRQAVVAIGITVISDRIGSDEFYDVIYLMLKLILATLKFGVLC